MAINIKMCYTTYQSYTYELEVCYENIKENYCFFVSDIFTKHRAGTRNSFRYHDCSCRYHRYSRSSNGSDADERRNRSYIS